MYANCSIQEIAVTTFNVAQVFYINLESRADRREHMCRQLAPCSWPIERVEAVRIDRDPKELGINILPRLAGQRGFVGIWLSHRMAIERALKIERDGVIVILEDDVKISPNFWTERLKLHKDLPSDWEIVLISPRHRRNLSATNAPGVGPKWIRDPFAGAPTLLRSKRGQFVTTGAHFVVFRSKAIAGKVLAEMDACPELYDVDLFYLQGFQTYAIHNSLVSTESLGSDHD